MAKRSGSYFPVRIDIPSLSGGVGRSSPAKRIPTESENIDNMIVSLEHSAEKRQGVELIDWEDDAAYSSYITGRLASVSDAINDVSAADKDLWFHWFLVSNAQTYLIAVDYKATGATDTLLWVYSIDSNGKLGTREVVDVDDTTREYITFGSGTYAAKDVLRAVSVGSSILILNNKVKAGFTSSVELNADGDEVNGGLLRKMDGTVTDTTPLSDSLGKEIKYATAVTVDPEGEAEVWTEWSQYIAGDTAYDTESRVSNSSSNSDNSDPFEGTENYDYLKYNIWEVKEEAGNIVGPDGSGHPIRRPSKGIGKRALNFRPAFNTSGDFRKGLWTSGWVGGTESTKSEMTWRFVYQEASATSTGAITSSSLMTTGSPTIQDSLDANQNGNVGTQLAYWDEDTRFASTNSGENAAAANAPRIKFWKDRSWNGEALGAPSGFNPPRGCKFSNSASYGSGTIDEWWVPGDPVNRNDATLFIHIGDIGTVGNLVEHVVKIINSAADLGFCHCTATATASLTGVVFDSWFYADQWKDTGKDTDYIEANNYFYPDQTRKFLGQAVAALNDLKFPPTETDLTAFNGGTRVADVLQALYPDVGNENGLGKIYYLSQQYLGLSEGYYRAKSVTDQPYLHKVRTPEDMSIIDKRRMPRQLVLNPNEGANPNKWQLREVDWDPRDSGSKQSNPGPSIFHDGDGNAIQREISAISFYRGRLFLASEDILVSSRIGDWDNFFIINPDGISVADPIDLQVSSNAYTPITYLQPYRNFLFLGTDGDTQYELLGSENQISPLTAEIAPTSFYNMTLDIEPVLLNNSLFFLAENKLYIYFGEQTDSNENAVEISVNCPDYLPANYSEVTTSSILNTIFVVDGDNRHIVYCYTNRLSGQEIAQNSFYRFIFPTTWSIKSMQAIGEYLHMVWEEEFTDSDGSSTWTTVNTGKLHLKNEDLEEPRLDSRILITSSDILKAPVYNGTTTTVWVKSPTLDIDTIVLWDDHSEGNGSSATRGDVLVATAATDTSAADGGVGNIDVNGGISLTVTGDYASGTLKFNSPDGFYIGKKYTSNIELSPIFLRDEAVNVQNGALNLRNGMFRYRNSGDFKVSVQRKLRTAQLSSFTIDIADRRTTGLAYKPYDDFGVFKVPVLSFTNDVIIKITSDSVHPLAISDIEFSAKFKRKMTSLGTM